MKSIITNPVLFEGYENTRLENHEERVARVGKACRFADLAKSELTGVPIAGYRDKTGELNIAFEEDTHALILGSTRSGKTTGYVIPFINIKARMKNKDSMIITDPKGELYRLTADRLRKEGYVVKLLNFRDYKHSEYWNPLTGIYRKYQAAMDILNEITARQTETGAWLYEFRGETYTDANKAEIRALKEQIVAINDVKNEIENFATNLVITYSSTDPYWEDSARDVLKAFIFAMLEDSRNETRGKRPLITEKTFSIRTILDIYGTFSFTKGRCEGDRGYFSGRPDGSLAKQLFTAPVLNNAETTRQCVLSAFNSKMAPFREIVAQMITCGNSMDLTALFGSKKPVAVFVSYRDEAKTSYSVIKQFVTEAYTVLIEKANERPELKLERPVYFLLDEFGNLPAIKDFDTVISACGGRNIWFVLVLQSYAQLASNYGADVAEIIKENLNMHVFFGTNSPDTKKAFSQECGQRTIVSPRSIYEGSGEELRIILDTVPVVPVSKLNCLEEGTCYITQSNSYSVLSSRIERSYRCEEYKNEDSSATDYKAAIDVFSDKYIYATAKMLAVQKKYTSFMDDDF